MSKNKLTVYDCHKQVLAGKIKEIVPLESGAAILHIEGGYQVDVFKSYMKKHEPEIGGYFVQYEDGYVSFSPPKVFEKGYKKAKPATATKQPKKVAKKPAKKVAKKK